MGARQASVIAAASTLLAFALAAEAHASYVPEAAMRKPSIMCPAFRRGAPPFPPQLISTFEAKWFSEQLSAAEEPVFQLRPPEGLRARYRFTLVPSFASTVTVRIDEHADGRFSLEAKRLSGMGGYGAGVVAGRVARALTPEETAALRSLLERANVRALDNDPCVGALGADGTEWLFEAVEPGGRQRFVRVWEPQGGAMRALGETFRRLAGSEFVHPPPGAPPKESRSQPIPRLP